VAGSCEHGDEHSGSIKCGEFLDKLSVLLASQEGIVSMELELDFTHIPQILLWAKPKVVEHIKKSTEFYFTYRYK
jgi:hypothetical protein